MVGNVEIGHPRVFYENVRELSKHNETDGKHSPGDYGHNRPNEDQHDVPAVCKPELQMKKKNKIKEHKIGCKTVESKINVLANDEKTQLTTVMGPTISFSWGFSLFSLPSFSLKKTTKPLSDTNYLFCTLAKMNI